MIGIALMIFILFLLLFLMETGNIWISMIGYGILGFFLMRKFINILNKALIPAIYELSSELVFPVGEGSALGYLVAASAVTAFVSGLCFSQFLKGETIQQSYTGVYVIAAIYCIVLILIGKSDQQLKRTDFEKNRAKIL